MVFFVRRADHSEALFGTRCRRVPRITLSTTEVRLSSQNRMGYRTNTLIAVASAMHGKFAPYLASLKWLSKMGFYLDQAIIRVDAALL